MDPDVERAYLKMWEPYLSPDRLERLKALLAEREPTPSQLNNGDALLLVTTHPALRRVK